MEDNLAKLRIKIDEKEKTSEKIIENLQKKKEEELKKENEDKQKRREEMDKNIIKQMEKLEENNKKFYEKQEKIEQNVFLMTNTRNRLKKEKEETFNKKRLLTIENRKKLSEEKQKKMNPKKITWKCLICKKDFTSEAKEYNNLEYKNLKLCVKEVLLNKIKAKPEKIVCKCNIDINSIIFYHKPSCSGELYIGEMDNRKIVVCNKCDSLGYYDNYIWTCPHCQKRFRIKKDNNKIYQTENNQKNHVNKLKNLKK